MLKHTQTIHWQMPTNCLSVFDNFVGLALKGLKGESGTAASNLSSSVFRKFLICNILDSNCGNTQFSPAFPHSFDFKFCTNSGAYLEPC